MASEAVKKQVLKRISPGPAEQKKVQTVVDNVIKIAQEITGLEVVTCGSFGKGTWLQGDLDLDVFIKFPVDTKREDLEKKGLAYGKKIVEKLEGKWIIKFAEHPYVHAIVDGYDVDAVPCYDIKPGEHIKSAVDRSPLHLAYVVENLNPKLFDEVRLLKQFMKGAEVYGSDTKTQGFAGYIAELLVMKYGSFDAVVKEASNWSGGQTIYIEKEKSEKKFKSPLVIIDPVDSERNVAAAVSSENFARFVHACKQFLQKPSESAFVAKSRALGAAEIKKLQQRGTYWIALVMKRPEVIDDILWPQLYRASARIGSMLNQEEFVAIRNAVWSGDVKGSDIVLLFEMEVWQLPHAKRMLGPSIYGGQHVKNFKKKYKDSDYGPFVESETWMIEKHRTFHTTLSLLETLKKLDKKTALDKGIPSYLAPLMKSLKIVEGKAFWQYVSKNKDFSNHLRKIYFEKLV